jgi:hypothetical protein
LTTISELVITVKILERNLVRLKELTVANSAKKLLTFYET